MKDNTITRECLLEILNVVEDSNRNKWMKQWAAKQAEKIRKNAQTEQSDGPF